jgi:hypothetical protein
VGEVELAEARLGLRGLRDQDEERGEEHRFELESEGSSGEV